MRGFICLAPSEWDSTNLERRYAKLLQTGEHFEGKKDNYDKFIAFVRQFQFWDKTGLPKGEKVWFFHPLAFIRHFRKCGWLFTEEFKQIYADVRYSKHQRPPPQQLRSTYLLPLNLAIRKFGLSSPTRMAHFLGQGAVESAWLSSMQETSMAGRLDDAGFHGSVKNPASMLPETELGHWYGELPVEADAWYRSKKFNSHGGLISGSYDWKNGNCDPIDAQKFRGRGFKQLTGRSNYADYWIFRGWILSSSFSPNWWTDPAYRNHNRQAMIKIPAEIRSPQDVALPENCIDSGGFYLRFQRPEVARCIDHDQPMPANSITELTKEKEISAAVTYAINGGHMDETSRLAFTRLAKTVLL
ncbi:hypothetical protein AB4Y32_37975 [Paraburkholderia phymatum]|uniref:Uncharacterized protein n=1 Tax=Paraburkholderia phymatum TaxID=148447 RepID=A0ACC6UCQ0_9BURK